MKKFVSSIFDQKGLTLIELLAALAISSIVLIIFYNVFMMGVKTFEKTGVEGQLRDEGDYIISNILSELYQTSSDQVNDCSAEEKAPCLLIKSNKELVKHSTKDVIQERVQSDDTQIKTIKFIFSGNKVRKQVKEAGKTTVVETLITDNPYNITGSSLSLNCARKTIDNKGCLTGAIAIEIKISNSLYSADTAIPVSPITLKSRLGF